MNEDTDRYELDGQVYEVRRELSGETIVVHLMSTQCRRCYGDGYIEEPFYNKHGDRAFSTREVCDGCDGEGVLNEQDGETLTLEEFHAWLHQRNLLVKRYGTGTPKSIADYFRVTG